MLRSAPPGMGEATCPLEPSVESPCLEEQSINPDPPRLPGGLAVETRENPQSQPGSGTPAPPPRSEGRGGLSTEGALEVATLN
ncbi:unnamed protein product, partial [Gulo gulo]